MFLGTATSREDWTPRLALAGLLPRATVSEGVITQQYFVSVLQTTTADSFTFHSEIVTEPGPSTRQINLSPETATGRRACGRSMVTTA